jgi:hypothetical protein
MTVSQQPQIPTTSLFVPQNDGFIEMSVGEPILVKSNLS